MSESGIREGDLAAATQELRAGRVEGAIALVRRAAEGEVSDAEICRRLGDALLAAGAEKEAAAAFVEAVRRDRSCAGAHAGLASIFDSRGDVTGAVAALREVVRYAPQDARALSRLGQLLTMFEVQEAEALLKRAMELDPGDVEAARHLGYVLRRLNRVEEAREVARGILARHPGDLQAALMLHLALSPVPASREAIAAERERFAKGIATLGTQVGLFASDPEQVLSLKWENFILAYHGEDDRVLQEGFGRLLTEIGRRAAPRFFAPLSRRRLARGDRVRIGFASAFLYDCTAGKYFRRWMTDLDRSRFEVFAYHTGYARDAFSASLARSVDHFSHLLQPAPVVAEAILRDRLDVLVYPAVGMDTASTLLACMRLAPVQCAGWGHPVTTGRPGIDYYVSCEGMEPEGAQSHYSERLVLLPGLGTRYDRPRPAGGRSRGDLGLPADRNLYLCPQSAFKIHPDNDPLLAAILAEDPKGALVLFRDADPVLSAAFRERLDRSLRSAGVEAAGRVIVLPRLGHSDYLEVNRLCDVFLDTRHWSGGNTTLDALAAGLPPVTLPGAFMRGRQSLAMLRVLGLEKELVAGDESGYVGIATRLGRDREYRQGISGRILAGADRLFDRPEPIAAFEAFVGGLVDREGD